MVHDRFRTRIVHESIERPKLLGPTTPIGRLRLQIVWFLFRFRANAPLLRYFSAIVSQIKCTLDTECKSICAFSPASPDTLIGRSILLTVGKNVLINVFVVSLCSSLRRGLLLEVQLHLQRSCHQTTISQLPRLL